MKWNIENIAFLHSPEDFTGAFDNEIMQLRHEEQLQKKLADLKSAIEQEDDPLKAMQKLNKKDHLQFLLNNFEMFKSRSALESAVLFLYGRLNAPFASGGDADLWNTLFSACDRTILRGLGEVVTCATATVYRGSVSGFKRSLCWTPEKKRAQHFAERWRDPSLGGGHIYEMDIRQDDVLIYLKQRHDDFFIVSPECIASAKIRDFRD